MFANASPTPESISVSRYASSMIGRLSLRILLATCLLFAPTASTQTAWPTVEWETATPADMGMDESQLLAARNYALQGGGSGYITRGGKLILSWGDDQQLYDLKSSSKSIGFTAMGLAILDGKLSLDDRAIDRHPSFVIPPDDNQDAPGRDQITLLHLASQTAGFEKPGGYGKLFYAPGTRWSYSDGGPNWLAECVTLAYQRDIQELLFDRILTRLGIHRDDLRWRNHQYRDPQVDGIESREFGSGVHSNVDAMARIGHLYLRGGEWNGKQLIPRDFVERVSKPVQQFAGLPSFDESAYPRASSHYGLLWWNNADGTLPRVPRDAFWSWGLHDSLIVVIPSLDIVVSRAGKGWIAGWAGDYSRLAPFLNPIVAAVENPPSARPDPPSPVITGIEWAPASSILRKADGSDNWPLTWANDGHQYTAYGDGWGFEPKVEKKLSLGLARIEGSPENFRGVNLRSTSGEEVGQGGAGLKASGILMLDAVLTWSADHGGTWQEADWRFKTSFGAPTFLNFAANYSGARDDYVYVYSQDNDSAYNPADRLVIARVARASIRDESAYEFFAGRDRRGSPRWSSSSSDRAGVFENPGRVYRSAVTYNAGLKRCLLCQIAYGGDTRFAGGFGVYDAPEPWGPWTAVYYTNYWDVGPGETCSFPAKWMSSDGKTINMVFSGEDAFSVRKAQLTTDQVKSR